MVQTNVTTTTSNTIEVTTVLICFRRSSHFNKDPESLVDKYAIHPMQI
jgi:hypothetical protein